MQNLSAAPIIFIHYGNANYLPYTIRSAKIFNPEKEVFLLGDATNQYLTKYGIKHIFFEEYDKGKEIELFKKVYQFIAGKTHQKHYWTNFVFKRWFLIHNFLKENQIKTFWTFDSDNLIFTNLSNQEHKFQDYDTTNQCNPTGCINGFVKNAAIVKAYVDKINELFQRKKYLESLKKEFEQAPHYAFTEMAAFKIFAQEANIKCIPLNTIIEDEFFSDAWLTNEEGMTLYQEKINNLKAKELYLNNLGEVFCKEKNTRNFIKVNTLNMSWIPNFYVRKLFQHSIKQFSAKKQVSQVPQLMDITPTFFDKMEEKYLYYRNRITKIIKT